MGRKCSHCGSIGHNSRTCAKQKGLSSIDDEDHSSCLGGFRLFGVQMQLSSSYSSSSLVQINNNAMKKSFSVDCLSSSSSLISSSTAATAAAAASSSTSSRHSISINDKLFHGYLSDGLIKGPTQERRKGEFLFYLKIYV